MHNKCNESGGIDGLDLIPSYAECDRKVPTI